MYDLFNPVPDNLEKKVVKSLEIFNDTTLVPGLIYVPNFITEIEEKQLISDINNQPWLKDIKRRVQHYGYKYDYKARSIDYSMFLGLLPDWVQPISKQLLSEGYIESMPDQMIINEYEPGQGIANHVDCEPCFGETIISISMNSYCVMDFINVKTKKKIELILEPRSLVVINSEARHSWSHGIPKRKFDFCNGTKVERKLRISLTFRKVILNNI